MKISVSEIYEIYRTLPAAQRKNCHWVMDEETFEYIVRQIPAAEKVGGRWPNYRDPGFLMGKPIEIRPDASGLTIVADCTCDLLDVSTLSGPRYIRGFSRGCGVHPPTEYELRILAAEEEARQADLAAQREARERP